MLSGEGKVLGFMVGEDGIVSLNNSKVSPRQRVIEYIPTQERYRKEGRVFIEFRYCMTCHQN